MPSTEIFSKRILNVASSFSQSPSDFLYILVLCSICHTHKEQGSENNGYWQYQTVKT